LHAIQTLSGHAILPRVGDSDLEPRLAGHPRSRPALGYLLPDPSLDQRGLSLAQLCKNLHIHADLQTNAVDRVDHADDQWMELAVEIFKMLADVTRVRIVLALRNGELSVNTLADVVGVAGCCVAAPSEAAASTYGDDPA